MRKLGFFICILLSISGFSLLGKDNKQETKENTSLTQLDPGVNKVSSVHGFADIVEPLMPAVVNVSTVQYPSKSGRQQQKSFNFPEGSPFEQFNEFFERFGMPLENEDLMERKSVSLGSGFIIDEEGYIVTNYHVIKDADEINVKLSDNKEYLAKLIGGDARTDLALLKIESDKKLPFVKFGDSSKVRVGEWVIAIGNPFGLGSTVTAGIVSAKARDVEHTATSLVDNYIQVDAALNRGNSGGPTFNLEGEVIGVNTLIYSSSGGGNVGIGFAIPSTTVKSIVEQIKKDGKITRGMLGVKIQNITEEIAESLGMKVDSGTIVVEVEKEGNAYKGGMQPGDIIVEYNNIPVTNSRKLQKLVAETPVNQEVEVVVMREGSSKKLKLRLLPQIEDTKLEASSKDSNSSSPKDSLTLNGIIFQNLDAETRQAYGINNNVNGVIISKLLPGSSWAKRGLLKGDILLSINQLNINDIAEFEKIYEQAKKDKKKNILFLVKRQQSIIYLAVPLVEKEEKKEEKKEE